MALKRVLESQGKIKLDTNVEFCHFEKVNTSRSFTPLTMKEKIARAKENASNSHISGTYRAKTDNISLVASEGERRATRKAEIIYWPVFCNTTRSYKFQLRFYVKKYELF